MKSRIEEVNELLVKANEQLYQDIMLIRHASTQDEIDSRTQTYEHDLEEYISLRLEMYSLAKASTI